MSHATGFVKEPCLTYAKILPSVFFVFIGTIIITQNYYSILGIVLKSVIVLSLHNKIIRFVFYKQEKIRPFTKPF